MDVVAARKEFAALYAANWKHILGFAARRCDTPADAADVASEVFLVAWRRIAEVPDGDEARLWLYGVARRVVANQRRSALRQRRLGRALLDAWTDAAGRDPAELFAAREEASAVRRALGRMRRSDAELLTLVAWEGLTPAGAAVVLGISPAAARARLSRARRRLRQVRNDGDEQQAGAGTDAFPMVTEAGS